MFRQSWQRELYRRFRRSGRGGRKCIALGQANKSPLLYFVVTLLAAVLSASVLMFFLEAKLQPIAAVAIKTKTQNTVTAVLEQAIAENNAECGIDYNDLVKIQRDNNGNITELTTDMAAMNQLKSNLVSIVLEHLDNIDVSDVAIPLGSLLGSELLWVKGPELKVRSISTGTVRAELKSEFLSAGLNQTLHRIYLHISVPMTVILPSGSVEVPVESRHCLAETIIVGQVPNTYLSQTGEEYGRTKRD